MKNKDKKPSVLIVEPAGNMWGSERVLLDFLASSDLTNDWTIGICCPPETPFSEHLDKSKFAVFPVLIPDLHLKSKLSWLITAMKLFNTAVKFKPTLLYINQAGISRLVYIVAKILQIPMVVHVRLFEDADYVSNLPQDKNIIKKFICISDFIKKAILKGRIIETERLTVLYDPYLETSEVKKGGQILKHNNVFVCVGRVTPIKGQDIFINAIADIKKVEKDIKGEIIGNAVSGVAFFEKIKKLICDLKLTSSVQLLGFKQDVVLYIQNAVALVCPSHVEALGRVIFEAWDAGVLPIAYACSGGAAEIIGESNGGLLYEKQEGPSLAEAMQKALAMQEDEKRELVENGRAWLRANCNLEAYMKNITDVWRDACNVK